MISHAPKPRPTTAISFPVILLAVIGVAVLGFALGPAIVYSTSPDAPRNDFLSFYAAPQLLLQGKLYDHAAEEELHLRLGWKPDQHKVAFIRPPFYAVLLTPLTLLDYRSAYITWQLLSAGAWCLSAVLWSHIGPRAVVLAFAWSLPAWFAWLRGQDVIFVFLLASIGLALFRRGWLFAAGLVFALCGIKWNLFIPLPFLLIARREYRTLTGWGTGCTTLLVTSFLSCGLDWPARYFHAILLPSAAPNRSQMLSVNSLMPEGSYGYLFELLLCIMLSCLAYKYASCALSSATVAVGLLAGLLISHHAYLYDGLTATPACVLLTRLTSFRYRVVGVLLLTPMIVGLLLSQTLSFLPQVLLATALLVLTRTGTGRGNIGCDYGDQRPRTGSEASSFFKATRRHIASFALSKSRYCRAYLTPT